MRAFQCPACDSDLEGVENVRESCCASKLVSVSVDSEACGAQVFSGNYA
jgi:transcription initiation factor IIE alpha subunit